jgi:hypothetical protein
MYFLDGGQLGLGNGEGDVYGLNLVDGDHVHIVGGDHVTLFDGEVAGASVDGRIDGGVTELHLGIFSRGLTGADGSLSAGDGGLVGIDGLGAGIGAGAQLLRLVLGNDAGGEELAVAFGLGILILGVSRIARHVGLGLEERGLVASDIGDGLVVGGFEGTAVDIEELLALSDEVAFLEVNIGQLTAHQSFDGDGGVGLDVADDLDFDRHVAGGGLGHGHGNIATAAASAALATAATAGRVCFRGGRAAVGTGAKGQSQNRRQAQNRERPERFSMAPEDRSRECRHSGIYLLGDSPHSNVTGWHGQWLKLGK